MSPLSHLNGVLTCVVKTSSICVCWCGDVTGVTGRGSVCFFHPECHPSKDERLFLGGLYAANGLVERLPAVFVCVCSRLYAPNAFACMSGL